jgi:hypothetical protein
VEQTAELVELVELDVLQLLAVHPKIELVVAELEQSFKQLDLEALVVEELVQQQQQVLMVQQLQVAAEAEEQTLQTVEAVALVLSS